MVIDFDVPMKEIERRKQVIRDIWNYKLDNIDHIPIQLIPIPNSKGYTLKERYTDKKKQLEVQVEKIKAGLQLMPDDYIPSLKPDLGYVVTQSIFGMKPTYSQDDQPPYVKKEPPKITKIDQIYKLKMPDPYHDGLMPEGLERIRYLMKETNYLFPCSLLDLGGPMDIAYELMDTELFFTIMYDAPDAMRYFLDFLTDVSIALRDACIEAAGGLENVTTTEWDEKWSPEGKKGYVSCDLSAMYSPKFFKKFAIPSNNKIFEKYGGGLLHNCGPHPAVEYYLLHEPKIFGITCDYWDLDTRTLEKIKILFDHRAILYVEMRITDSIHSVATDYKRLMDALTPNVIAIPWMWIGPSPSLYSSPPHIDVYRDTPIIYTELLKVAKEYARRMKKG
ncbi:hypothetical protein DRN85_09765 [Methanosarcinales archaeon]|nr:MAG: hypothetical protein DRN85_09765 [Methanosarcinales archaeon]